MLAAVFPGQGSQFVGMGRELYEAFPVARQTFATADDLLGFPLSRLCFEGPAEALQQTANSQPAILTTSVALYRVLQERSRFDAQITAGHSLGEYSALVFAGVLAFEDAVRLVRQRGIFMQEAVPDSQGAMAAIHGSVEAVETLCRDASQGDILSVASYNSPQQTVIAGSASAVTRAVTLATDRGLSAVPLKVSAPFHCALMKPAADRLRPLLEATTFRDARVPVVGNIDAAPSTSGSALRAKLIAQVTEPVRWDLSVREIARAGAQRVVEIGPDEVLTGLIKRTEPRLRTVATTAKANLDALLREFSRDAAPPGPRPWARMSPEEKDAEIARLLPFDEIARRFDAKPHEIYRWISVDLMPTWLFDGELHFHPDELDRWLEGIGDVERLREKQRAEAHV